ncbi:hypothetical protein OKW21_000068 [Catalinimonas alkaloidigena]|uniref:hypothetical protein n=1 Tax=Catalinimonas alkaloidigena TaxID=1075417 RepID=UPI002406703D|nr:hypothetical protein [Catalinimonas alkaloidigena]MDF9794805.1 hypothetical protein [Catalinimonas alkaloidigena]
MTNYIIISHFNEEQDQASFEKKIKESFPRYHEENTEEIRYLALSSRNQAGVEDKIKEILNEYGISDDEYVALYYSRPENPDEIQRSMILGHDHLIENDIQQVKPEDHVDTLSRLLNHEFFDKS